MSKDILKKYLSELSDTYNRGDAREESYYGHLKELILQSADILECDEAKVTTLPKKTEAGNPDLRVWDGKSHITGYFEAKNPSKTDLNAIEHTEQLKRYLSTFPNVILTNFYEFRLYRNGDEIKRVKIGRPEVALRLETTPPVENSDEFFELMDRFLSFSVPKVNTSKELAIELAKRTQFLRDEVIAIELEDENSEGHRQIMGFYNAFKEYLIATLEEKEFANLYAQTITYGLFAARTRAKGEFNRKLAFEYIPKTIGILRDVFHFISLEDPPKSLRAIVEDIAEILYITDVNEILQEYYEAGRGSDPIIHFYETFLETYDPEIRNKRGVYYTPEPVVKYIVNSIHDLLKSRFDLSDGLASKDVKLLDPASGTQTFPARAIELATKEHIDKYGDGDLKNWIRTHILENFYSFELMMAPYAIGHLKMSFIFDELGYELADNERYKLYLTNTLDMGEIKQVEMPLVRSLSKESQKAAKVKKEQPILVIMGNPPYYGASTNNNEWTEELLKEDKDGVQSYYKIDDKPLNEKNPKWLKDDYVKFLRFAQWKIHNSGHGIVGMITNHSYLDNPTFRGMRQSLMKTFDEIYILDLHGNSLKKETTPEGGKDENVFDIRQGVAIALFVKNKDAKEHKVYHLDQFGLRNDKYDWLINNDFSKDNYREIKPKSPWYFFIPRETSHIQHYLEWPKINDIFPVNSVGIVTSRDKFVIDFDKNTMLNRIRNFSNLDQPDEIITQAYNLKDKSNWSLREAREDVNSIDNYEEYIERISYRPFDERYIFYFKSLIERRRYKVMKHILHDNLSICFMRQYSGNSPYSHFIVSEYMVDNRTFYSSKGIIQQAPLYIYTEELDEVELFTNPDGEKKPNISPGIFDGLLDTFGNIPSPEDIFYYIYTIFYSNIYRETYEEFLKIDFPRVPFTADYELFQKMSEYGQKLADLHLLKSEELDKPLVKYYGQSDNDTIEKYDYVEKEQRVYINDDKYFAGITPDVWNYYIGGYQVLRKYLKDRKGRDMEDAPRYCRIATALSKTIEIQREIDNIYPQVEEDVVKF